MWIHRRKYFVLVQISRIFIQIKKNSIVLLLSLFEAANTDIRIRTGRGGGGGFESSNAAEFWKKYGETELNCAFCFVYKSTE